MKNKVIFVIFACLLTGFYSQSKANVELKQVQQWLGHRSIDLTLSYYKAFNQNVEFKDMEVLWDYI